MKFPLPYAVFLLIVVAAFMAGCSSSPPAPETATPAHAVTTSVQPATIPVRSSELSRFVLLRSEIPFVVVNEKNQIPDLSDPAFSRFGAIRGYTYYTINETDDSPTAQQLGQTIAEFPAGKAALAFADFIAQNRNPAPSDYNITWLADPKIGDESCALVIVDTTGSRKPLAMVAFRKSGYMETVTMISRSPDTDALIRTARIAAAKIP